MKDKTSLRPPSRKRRIISPLVIFLIACALTYYLLCPAGPFSLFLRLDLGFLILPLLGFFVLLLFSKICAILISSLSGRAASVFLNAAAFSFLSYVVFSRASLFARIPVLADHQAILNDVSRLAPYAVLLFIGYAIIQFSYYLTDTSFDRNSAPAVRFLGYIIIGIALWRSSAIFVTYWSSVTDLGLVFFSAMLAVAVSHLGYYGQKNNNRLIADISGWLRSSPVNKFFWGLLISLYFVFILPVIVSHSRYAHLITWFLICLVAYRIFTNIRNGLQTRYSQPEKETQWEKHIQQVEERIDEDYQLMTLFQSSFVAENDKEVLLTYLKKVLQNNHVTDEDVTRLLSSFAGYRDSKIPWYAVGYWRSRIRQRNQRKRRQMLDTLFSDLAEHLCS